MAPETYQAAVFGAMAMAKKNAGEPTTEQEDQIILGGIGRAFMLKVEAGRREQAAAQELIAA